MNNACKFWSNSPYVNKTEIPQYCLLGGNYIFAPCACYGDKARCTASQKIKEENMILTYRTEKMNEFLDMLNYNDIFTRFDPKRFSFSLSAHNTTVNVDLFPEYSTYCKAYNYDLYNCIADLKKLLGDDGFKRTMNQKFFGCMYRGLQVLLLKPYEDFIEKIYAEEREIKNDLE